MHRYLSTDNGLQCFRCGIALDFDAPESPDDGRLEDIARSLAFGLCHEPTDDRAHHYVLEGIPGTADDVTGYALQCAYDGARVTADTLPATVDPSCTGA